MRKQPKAADYYCRHCESAVVKDAKYCHECGYSLTLDVHRDHVDRIVEFFPHYYITFISIIQSASLGYLLISIKDRFATMLGTGAYSLIWVIFIVATFSVIVAVWQEYMNGSQAWRWVPRLPDAIIPFLLGLTEGFLIYGIDFQKPDWWYFSMSIVCVVSFFAYFNMYRASRKLYDKNRYVMELLGEIPRINEIAILVFAAMFFAFGAIESMWNLNSLYLATFSLACIFVWIIRGSISWKRILER